MFTDTVGYTAATQADERRSLDLLRQQSEVVRPLVAVHQGREVKSTGDGFLIEFDSALKAIQCALSIQRRLSERNAEGGLAPILIRIGIHLGDVVQNGADILGDAVNVAARIEPLAEPGGISLSAAVYEQVRHKIPDRMERVGPTALKGVQVPVDIYRIVPSWKDGGSVDPGKDPATLDKSRIAVLPFVNISPDPNDEFFADGLTEELIASLSLVKGLKVIARTSVMGYKRKEKMVSEIGRELGVGTVVEGSVRRVANRIRVTVQVIEVASEEHLWASKYDDDLDDVFAVQSDIATKVAASIPGNLAATRAPMPPLEQARDTGAYLAYLQGQALMWKRDEGALRQSLQCFERAAQMDPGFARAHAGIARAYTRLGYEGYLPWAEANSRARTAAERACKLNPELAEAHCVLAELGLMADDDLALQQREARRALELNPNLAEAHDVLGQIAGGEGDLDTYLVQAQAAYRLDPLSPASISYLGRALFFAGRLEEALALWQQTLHLDPTSCYRGMADYYMLKGDYVRADEMVRELERIDPGGDFAVLNRGYLAALKGDRTTALKMIDELFARFKPGSSRRSSAGFIYLALGDLDAFFEVMFESARDHTIQSARLRFSPLFAAARQDPRFPLLFDVRYLGSSTPPPIPELDARASSRAPGNIEGPARSPDRPWVGHGTSASRRATGVGAAEARPEGAGRIRHRAEPDADEIILPCLTVVGR